MIDIYPNAQSLSAICPRCSSTSEGSGKVYFQGTHVLAEHRCNDCGFDYYASLPIGHAALYPVTFSQDGKYAQYNLEKGTWMALPLIKSLQEKPEREAEINLFQVQKGRELLLVNCLDSCFGHVFTKIWNVYLLKKKFPTNTLAVLLPARCSWLINDEMVEIWAVDLPLQEIDKGVKHLDSWVKEQFKRFDRVTLSVVPVHVDQEQLNFGKILQAKPFDLADFGRLPVQLTFIWRNDRFWLNSRLLDLLHKASIKFGGLSLLRGLFCYQQARLMGRLFQKIRKVLPDANFIVTGLGKQGRLGSGLQDRRVEQIDLSVEREWNEIYRQSHLVIGVHGSHMLIPTALSAGFIEILPRHKLPHITEDIGRHQPGRLAHFLGRFVDEFSSPHLVSRHVLAVVKGFGFIYTNFIKQSNGNLFKNIQGLKESDNPN
ncbi:hypothetical protein [Cyclobacterium sp.]|uniref:hypothetical protein n=1 Tax=Cyclobacterium sp. TaxID=1966343 RepID=UPI0019B8FE5B|nr:hypothetical protein [Cyclobacterium sp.]MBD3627492.1 hypothetical protein [Cyclobacterium sp.]